VQETACLIRSTMSVVQEKGSEHFKDWPNHQGVRSLTYNVTIGH